MARYTGPRSRIARRFREPIFGEDKALARKNYPPGMHGPLKRRRKQSEYAIQLQEKQKAKYIYGMLERQFRRFFEIASSMKGITGLNLLRLCESRLDNLVYRMGIAPTRAAARQLVNHGHITVNGEVVKIPSYIVKPGSTIAVREKSKSLQVIRNHVHSTKNKLDWIDFNPNTLTGTFIALPEREQIPENINEQLIVELYSK
ncbi:MAG: 30S ribosomal protein S4 [Flavobacteriales bacterium]|nr:30S ribosomal protein S4 [Flavobacteriales bacterium]MCX7768019.1 30S ribosomal protein S4 [Flavobacteriales bacterium]MDW8409224.1 30S ribosomal protein S4 [Flavobacteriales bacterium]